MPYVFTDEAGTADLAITTSADWTVDSAVLPNGDNAVHGDGTIAATYYPFGTALDFRTGNWTVEFWVWTTGISGSIQCLLFYGPPASGTPNWQCYMTASEEIAFGLYSTTNPKRIRTTSSLSTSTWHHIVCQKANGVDDPTIYVDTVSSGSASGANGTANTPGATDRLYLGTQGDGNSDIGTAIRIAKLAIYDRLITTGEISDHYLAMTA